MKRHLLNFLTALSVVALVAVVGLWVRSGFRFDSILYNPPPTPPQKFVSPSGTPHTLSFVYGWSASSHRGAVQFQRQTMLLLVDILPRPGRPPKRESSWRYFSQPLGPSNEAGFLSGTGAKGLLGFWIVRRTQPQTLRPGQLPDYDVRDVFVPYWFLATLTAAVPLARLVPVLRRRARLRRGRCVRCGYDLTGNVSGICTECGAPARVMRQARVE